MYILWTSTLDNHHDALTSSSSYDIYRSLPLDLPSWISWPLVHTAAWPSALTSFHPRSPKQASMMAFREANATSYWLHTHGNMSANSSHAIVWSGSIDLLQIMWRKPGWRDEARYICWLGFEISFNACVMPSSDCVQTHGEARFGIVERCSSFVTLHAAQVLTTVSISSAAVRLIEIVRSKSYQ